MWQAVGKVRYRRIWLQNDILRAEDAYEVLWPFTKPDLPTEFAKVIDSRSAIRFERRYSPLGYDLLVIDSDKRQGGDPLEWVLKQANFVKLTLELIYALAYQDGNNALKQFRYFHIERIDNSHPALQGTGNFTYPAGAYDYKTIIPVPLYNEDALLATPHIIEMLVNANTENIREKLVVHHKGRLGSVLFYNALIEAIWSMLGELALKTQQGYESGYFVRCEWCRTPFLATDKRQKFCPAPEGYGSRQQSLCGLKYRQHKLQVKPEKEVQIERPHNQEE